ncbi:MAG: RnfABCDGE type electron transport complex subunit B [Betaproteobacteria bacterium]
MKRPAVALVDEARCIGCTRCIDACPVDAIVGAQGLMHTVVEPWCIGCALCLPPCPVDCIEMVPRQDAWTETLRRAAGARGRRRKARLERERIVPAARDRRAVLAEILAKKR